MKRIFTIVLAVMMIMSVLTGCGRSDNAKPSPTPIVTTTPSTNNTGGNMGNGNVDDGINSDGNLGDDKGSGGIIDDAGDAIQDAGNAVEDAVDDMMSPAPSVSPSGSAKNRNK